MNHEIEFFRHHYESMLDIVQNNSFDMKAGERLNFELKGWKEKYYTVQKEVTDHQKHAAYCQLERDQFREEAKDLQI